MGKDAITNLNQFIDSGLDDCMRQAMMKAVSIVQEAAQSKAPRDTGTLARSIQVDVEQDGSQGVIYSNVEYAPYVEIGTGIHSSKGTGRKSPWRYKGSHGWVTTSGNKAQPFLEPAANDNSDKITNCFEGLI